MGSCRHVASSTKVDWSEYKISYLIQESARSTNLSKEGGPNRSYQHQGAVGYNEEFAKGTKRNAEDGCTVSKTNRTVTLVETEGTQKSADRSPRRTTVKIRRKEHADEIKRAEYGNGASFKNTPEVGPCASTSSPSGASRSFARKKPSWFISDREFVKKIAEKLREVSEPELGAPVTQNIVFKVDFGIPVEINKVAGRNANVLYDPTSFASGRMWLKYPHCAGLLSASGKLVCVGTSTRETARLASHKFRLRLEDIGYSPQFIKPRIENKVASGNMGFCISLARLGSKYSSNTSWQPKTFPGLVWFEDSITALIFDSGKYILMGFVDNRDAENAFRKLKPILEKFKDDSLPTSPDKKYEYRILQNGLCSVIQKKKEDLESVDTDQTLLNSVEAALKCLEQRKKMRLESVV